MGTVRHAAPDVKEMACDLTNPTEVHAALEALRPQYVLHLAGITHLAHGDRSDFYRVNLLGTFNLLNAMDQVGLQPKKIVIASSGNVYGNANVEPISESTPACPISDYAVSKLAMEQMAQLWFERFPIIIARPFNYTGVGQSTAFLLPKIVDHYRRRAPVIELGNVDVARDFSDVRTIAECYARMLGCEHSGQVVNICSGTGTTIRQILNAMEGISGHRLEVRSNPALVRRNEIERLVGSFQKLVEMVGPLPRMGLEETLRWMFEEPAGTVGAA